MGDRLEGKTAIVTGAAGGVGKAIATKFVNEGATVHVADITQERCEDACHEIGEGAVPAQVDLADVSSIKAMVEKAANASPRLDILVQCAAVVSMQPITEITEEEFDRVNNINYRGVAFTLSEVAKRMIPDGKGGAIVNFTTLNRGYPWIGAYVSSKHGVSGITRCSALELIKYGIRVNSICPGPIKTPLMDDLIKRFADNPPPGSEYLQEQGFVVPAGYESTPEDYVEPTMLLVTPAGAYIIGQVMQVDGGISA